MIKEDFDRLFDEAFEEASKNHISSLDPHPSWEKLRPNLQKLSKRGSRLRILPYLAASFLLGALIFGSPLVTEATHPVVKMIKDAQSGVVSLIFGHSDMDESRAKTTRPPDNQAIQEGAVVAGGELTAKQFNTWEEASKSVLFAPYKIAFVPDNFDVAEIKLYFKSGQEKANNAVLAYANKSNPKYFFITFRTLEKNEMLSSSSDKGGAHFETIDINGNKAFLLITTDGRSSIEYMTANNFTSISGVLTKDEIVKIAENIKYK